MALRDVFRTLIWDAHSGFVRMFEVCYVFVDLFSLMSSGTLWLMYGACRRSVLSRFLGGILAQIWPREFRKEPVLPEVIPKRPPLSGSHTRSEHLQSSKVVSSEAGCGVHMKWPRETGRVVLLSPMPQ